MIAAPAEPSNARSPRARKLILAAALLLLIAFFALGTWQVQRRAWKLALIERVEQRANAAPVAVPGPERWPTINAADDEYRRVVVSGEYLLGAQTTVQAATELGAGFWVITPLRQADGSVVLVNRGFVPPERREPATRAAADPAGPVRVTGLLRISEPGGGFLRDNDPAAGRWHSRDVAAIAAALGLSNTAPYFIDAAAEPGDTRDGQPPEGPVAGLTVLRFHNNHLIYALTWYALAGGVAWGAWRIGRERPGVAAAGETR